MSGYIGTQPVPQATQTRDSFTATANQTSFATSGYTPEFLDVFLNGVKLAAADYTATNGSDVVLASGAAVNDILEVVAYSTFEVLNPTFDGNVTFTGNASFGDNDKAIFGDGSDLQIYHDGTHSYVDDSSGTGRLILKTDYLEVQNAAGNEAILGGIQDGAVSLFYNGNTKLATTSTGINVTGTVNAVKADIDISTNARLTINDIISEVGDGNVALQAQNSAGSALKPMGFRAEDIRFATGSTERMRLDSSGNLLVGKTTGAFATAGTKIAPLGQVEITAASDGSLALGRTGSYGYIQRFYKDSVIAGYIGSYSGSGSNQFYISGADTGFKFNSTVDIIGPSNANGDTRDNAISLGDSGGRFKDLYLGGGIYLGGTGSANKLDDYEEGTWTPSPATGSWTVHSARYTKVGRLVNCSFKVTATVGGTGGDITGLPFTALDGSGNGVVGFQNWDSASWTVHVETTKVSMRKGPASQTLGNATSAYVTFTYFTA